MTVTDERAPSNAPRGAPPEVSEAPATRRRRLRISIQSKLLLMLLATSVLSALIVGFVGYRSGTDALRDSAFDRLTEVRESRISELDLRLEMLEDSMVVYSRGRTAAEAVEAFSAGYDELQSSELSADEDAAVDDYYADVFVPELEKQLGVDSAPEGFIPDNLSTRYLQRHYTVPFEGDFDAAIELDDAGDGSAWSAAHAQFHDYFRELVLRFEYEDVLLVDAEGRVVYSAYKGIDLGAHLMEGRFDRTGVANAAREAMAADDPDFVASTDFERYQPSYGLPTAWTASPIYDRDELVGVLAVQIPFEAINDIMTAGGDWEDQGLGDTGETYLAGPDRLMRSVSRLVLEDPDEYQRKAVAAGLDPDTAQFAAEVAGTILLQTVDTEAVRRALAGETGTLIGEEYLGEESLVAYAPLDAIGLPWVIVAKLDADEAFAPNREFARDLGIALAAIVFVVCLASLLLAQIFVRPVRRLVAGVRAVAAGDLTARVDAGSNDEFGDLAAAFNDMSHSLEAKQRQLDEERADNERLLLNQMPEPVARRFREGEESITEDHQDVAVVFADLIGFEEYARQMPSDEGLALLNTIMRNFDDAADRIGVERVRTLRSGYLATSGLTVRRVDNVRRALDFAVELTQIITRINAQSGTEFGIRAGVTRGVVTSGLVGRSNMVFDLWGDAVNLAYRMRGVTGEAGVYVSSDVHDRVRDIATFELAGEVATGPGSTAPVWKLVAR